MGSINFMKVAYIINPFSAKKEYQSFLNELQQKVENPLFHISKSIEDTHLFMEKNMENIDVFVAVGGDGTISTITQKLINTDKILGIFPAGSGNGFARESNFSKNLDDLLLKIQQKKIKEIDTFTINDRLSINVSGAGFDGEVAKNFEKTSRGFANYIKTCVTTFFGFKPITIHFEEKHKQHNGEYMMINIANTRQFGNNAYIAPNANVTDGLADIVLVKKFPIWYGIFFAIGLFTKSLKDGKYIKFFSTDELNFTLNSDSWHLDGEYTPIKSPIKMKINPKSLKILI